MIAIYVLIGVVGVMALSATSSWLYERHWVPARQRVQPRYDRIEKFLDVMAAPTAPWRKFRRWRNRVPECESRMCAGKQNRHRKCHYCGALTCSREGAIDPGSLRRTLIAVCGAHDLFFDSLQQSKLREQRTKADWGHRKDGLPDQYPGSTRDQLHDFVVESDEEFVPSEVGAETLNQSIRTLGIDDDVYAEQRSRGTFLRRLPKDKGK